MSPLKMTEPIEMHLFGLLTQVGPKNHVLDADPNSPKEKDNFVWTYLDMLGNACSRYTQQGDVASGFLEL